MNPIVFLHIPKTAGQTIHFELAKLVGEKNVSPVRVHTAPHKGLQMPPGFRLYSGHLDWGELDTLPEDRFVFSVLRDPRERIASFYFFQLRRAEAASAEELQLPQSAGLRRILEGSVDDYFFPKDNVWKHFILDHYDNHYCCFFATQKIRGRRLLGELTSKEQIDRALTGVSAIDRIYKTDGLAALEKDILNGLGARIHLVDNFRNSGSNPGREARWPKLMEMLEADQNRARLEGFCTRDDELMKRIDFVTV